MSADADAALSHIDDLDVPEAIALILRHAKKRQDQVDALAELFEKRTSAEVAERLLNFRTMTPGMACSWDEVAPGVTIGRNGNGSVVEVEIENLS